MAHYAKIVNGIVHDVIVADAEYISTLPGYWVQTSYNTRGNQHPEGKPLRANFAAIGYVYDADADVFYAPQPFPSWILNKNTYLWEAPVTSPNQPGQYGKFFWNEAAQNWVETV